MIHRGRLIALLLSLAGAFALPSAPLSAGEIRPEQYLHRSVSSSGQFVIYCPDTRLRLAVTGYVDTAKEAVLSTLGISDHWKIPIVITMLPTETTRPGVPLSRLTAVYTDEGPKIDLVVSLREEDFRQVQFPQMVIRAVLLEISHRDQLQRGITKTVEPPEWLVEAVARHLEVRQTAKTPNAGMFRAMIASGRIPPIREFLSGIPGRMDPTAQTIFAECSASLLDMLLTLPGGRRSLYRAVVSLPTTGNDPADFLLQHFKALGNSEEALERWWTLGIARYSASDRYLTLSVAQTEEKLVPLLSIDVVTDLKSGERATFRLEDYAKYARLRTATAPLLERVSELTALHVRSHPLMRPVVAEYQRIAQLIASGRTRNLEKPLDVIGNYRSMIVERSGNITDYLNWFEATQMPERSGAFDGYLRLADGLRKAPERPRNDALSRYVDQVEREFQ